MTPAVPEFLVSRHTAAWLTAIMLAAALVATSHVVSPDAFIILPVLAIGGLALMRWPWLVVALLVASVPVQQVGAAVSGLLTVTRVSLVVTVAGLVLWWTVSKQPVVWNWFAMPYIALMGWMIVTAHVAIDLNAATSDLFRWSIALFTFLAMLQVLIRAPDRIITTVILTIAVAGAIEATIGTVGGLLGVGPESFVVANTFSRAYGTFGRPNTFAGYLEMAVFPVLWFGIFWIGKWTSELRAYVVARRTGFVASSAERRDFLVTSFMTLLLLSSASVMLAGIAISFSRGAWLGVATGIAVTLVFALRRYWHVVVPAVPVGVLAGVVALTLFAPSTITQRIASISEEARPFDASSITVTDDNFAVVERMAHWQAGWQMFEDHPLTGVGAGNFNSSYPDYYVREQFRTSQGHAHNFYIHMLAENGIVGLAIYLTLILSFALVAVRVALASTDGFARALALGALGTMTAVYIHNIFENLHVLNLGIQLNLAWVLALVALHRWRQSEATGKPRRVEYSRG